MLTLAWAIAERKADHRRRIIAALTPIARDAIEARARVDRHEENHIRRAVQELSEFQNRRQRGQFDRNSLNDALHHLRDLAQADQLHPRDRRIIAAHLNELYRLREGGNFSGDRRY